MKVYESVGTFLSGIIYRSNADVDSGNLDSDHATEVKKILD